MREMAEGREDCWRGEMPDRHETVEKTGQLSEVFSDRQARLGLRLKYLNDYINNHVSRAKFAPTPSIRDYPALRWQVANASAIPRHVYAYPDDAVVDVNSDEAVFPGMGAGEPDDWNNPGRFTIWDKVEYISGDDDTQVMIGRVGNGEEQTKFIIDPVTRKALSPGFTSIGFLSHDGCDVMIGDGCSYTLSTLPSLVEPRRSERTEHMQKYPDFLLADRVHMGRKLYELAPIAKDAPQQLGRIATENMFGLELPTGEMQAKRVLHKAFRWIAEYAKQDLTVYQQMKRSDETVHLPRISTPVLTAQLSLATTSDNCNTLCLVRETKNQDSPGLRLVQDDTGAVDIYINATGERVAKDTPEYVQTVDRLDQLLEAYFQRLYERKTGGECSATKLAEYRADIAAGGWRARKAQKAMRKMITAYRTRR